MTIYINVTMVYLYEFVLEMLLWIIGLQVPKLK